MLKLIPLPTPRINSVWSPGKVHLVWRFVPFQAIAALKLSSFPRLRVFALDFRNKLGWQCSPDGLSGLFLYPPCLTFLRHRVWIRCRPPDVQNLVMVEGPKTQIS